MEDVYLGDGRRQRDSHRAIREGSDGREGRDKGRIINSSNIVMRFGGDVKVGAGVSIRIIRDE
jgi:hypothetical protein